jgi:Protein of unknown function (DUF2846)
VRQRCPRFTAILGLAVFLSACAGTAGPQSKDAESTFPSLGPDKARIIFYRWQFPGPFFKPDIMLNGNKMGEAVAGRSFYLDLPPGSYEVKVSTEVERKATCRLDAGETKFVRIKAGLGVAVARFYPEPVDKETAMKDMAEGPITLAQPTPGP